MITWLVVTKHGLRIVEGTQQEYEAEASYYLLVNPEHVQVLRIG